MNTFFDFLEEHIEKNGYNNMRRQYMLTPLESELYQLNANGFLEREPDCYNKPDRVSTLLANSDELITTDEILCDIVFLNPNKLFKITKTYDDKNNIINEKKESLYQDLLNIYKKEFKKFKNYYGTYLIDNSQQLDRKQFDDGLILKLNYYLEIVEKQWYIVYKNDTDSLNLIKNYLQKVIQWVQENKKQHEKNQEIKVSPEKDIISDESPNKFNRMTIMEVKEYFNTLLSNSKNGKPYLSIEQFNTFLKTVFIEGTNLIDDKIEMNLGRGENKIIINIFYQFYSNSVKSIQYEANFQTKDKYVKLLTDNFSNFDYSKVKNNFR